MLDTDVREALHKRLRYAHRGELDDTRFIDELSIAGQVRIDTAVLNGSFCGYEIKSDRDTLRRLPRQVEIYSEVLDEATLVVGSRHLEKSMDMLPGWWGVLVAKTNRSGNVTLVRARRNRRNPSIHARTLCTLLWRDETLSALAQRNLDAGWRTKPKNALWDRLAAEVPEDELVRLVRETLKSRKNWRVDAA